jgi:hypothetical protein
MREQPGNGLARSDDFSRDTIGRGSIARRLHTQVRIAGDSDIHVSPHTGTQGRCNGAGPRVCSERRIAAMGPSRFDRGLARPQTLCFLRELLGESNGQCWSRGIGRAQRRCSASAGAALRPDEERDEQRGRGDDASDTHLTPMTSARTRSRFPFIRKVNNEVLLPGARPTAEQLLGARAVEYGMRMSFASGVPILDAQLDGKNAFNGMAYQADVNNDKSLGKLLVDQPEHSGNVRLWAELMQFRLRIGGTSGALDVWFGIRRRGLNLPVEGDEAHFFWPPIIRAMLNHDTDVRNRSAWLSSLVEHALDIRSRTGLHYQDLYKCIILGQVHWPAFVIHWHTRLVKANLVPADCLKQVAPHFVQNRKMLQQLYKRCPERDLYDVVIGACLDDDDAKTALYWHRWLLRQGDGPSQSMFKDQRVQELFDTDQDRSLPMKHNDAPQPVGDAKQVAELPALTRPGMSSLLGDVHGIKPKEISDTFVAKMFATRAFSLDIVIKGLSFFSIEKLGPVALREMAIRAKTPVEFCNKVADLKAMNIQLSDSIYCRILHKLASDGQTTLFTELLASDQHPEAYEDVQTQEALLVSFFESGHWTQAHITLLGLALSGGKPHFRASNRVMQHYLRNRNWQGLPQIMHTMQIHKTPLTWTTVTFLFRYLLPERRVRRRPVESQRPDRPRFHSLDFVTNACMYAEALQPGFVKPSLWIELLKRHGMTFRWDELERLVLWIVQHYKTHGGSFPRPKFDDRLVGSSRASKRLARRNLIHALQRAEPLRAILNTDRKEAMFGWSFRHAGMKNLLKPLDDLDPRHAQTAGGTHAEPWAKGLALLKHLRDYYKIPINIRNLRKVVITRLWVLFGPAWSKVRHHELIRERNQLCLGRFIKHINEIWDTPRPLFARINPDILEAAATGKDPRAEAMLVTLLFGKAKEGGGLRKTGNYKHVQEYVDVGLFAKLIASSPEGLRGLERRRGKDSYQRQRQWQHSPLRVVRWKQAPSPYAPPTHETPAGAKWDAREDAERRKWGGARVPVVEGTRWLELQPLSSEPASPALGQDKGQQTVVKEEAIAEGAGVGVGV